MLDRASTPNHTIGLFTCADAVGQRQFNAWSSWKEIPDCAVSILGDAPGVSEQAKRFGFRSIAPVKRDDFGRPLLDWIFERMHDESRESVLGYVNSDIILLPGLKASVAAVRAQFKEFLIVARRWNIEGLPAIDFGFGWDEKLRNLVTRHGELFTPYGIDLFVFSRGLLREIPPFALGSDYWDNYLVMRTRRRGYPVIDVTQQVMLVHQNHALGKYRTADERRRSPEGLRAFALAGDSYAMLGRTTDATHMIAHGELGRAETAHVTAILTHHGDTRQLCRCLRLLESQTYPQSYLNAIVVNNDPDAPLRYLEADFPSVRVVREPRPGSGAARHKGISCATGEVVALFSPDVAPATNCLEQAMRVMKNQPECRVVICRVNPIFASGKTTYIGRAAEWFDAVTYYNPRDWSTCTGAFRTGALVVGREVFAKYGDFCEFGPEAASRDWEWTRRVTAAGVKVAFCSEAAVHRETVRSIAELRRKEQRHARGDCVLKVSERSEAYGVEDVLRDEWRKFRERVWSVWKDRRIPPRYRAGAVLVSAWCFVWALRAKLAFRNEAQRIARRRKRAMGRTDPANADAGRARAVAPFCWLGARRRDLYKAPRESKERSRDGGYSPAGLPGLEILRCPVSHSSLRWLSSPEIKKLNERIRVGSLRQLDGTVVERPLTAALASAGDEFMYRVEDGIFFLLSPTAMRSDQSATVAPFCDLPSEMKIVRHFYDEFGWRISDGGVFGDALRFEDLRPVSRSYIRSCHLRLGNHLPPRGSYLLDAASGPIQYPEYLTYSASYNFRICADVSEMALREARKKLGERGIYLLCDVTSLPLKNGVVDGFVSLHTIYHVPARQQGKAIAELYRVLREHGSGVVVYSWGSQSSLMKAALAESHPLQALGKIASAVRSLLNHRKASRERPGPRLLENTGREPSALNGEPSLFAHSHDFAWYRQNVERKYRSRLASWRSVSVPFLKRFVHERALGRPLLALLYSLESRFPRWFGRHGQYPVFVFTKDHGLDHSLRKTTTTAMIGRP